MLGKSNFIVACLLAGTSRAVLDHDKVSAYQRSLALGKGRDSGYEHENESLDL